MAFILDPILNFLNQVFYLYLVVVKTGGRDWLNFFDKNLNMVLNFINYTAENIWKTYPRPHKNSYI